MTITPTALLSLPIITTGTESGTWGDVVDNGLTSYLDIAIAGGLAITITTADVTLANTAGTSSATNIGATTAQYAILNIRGAKTAARNLTLPAASKYYLINNAGTSTGGPFLLTVRGAGPTTGVTLQDGEKAIVAWDGTDYVKLAGLSQGTSAPNAQFKVVNTTVGLTAGIIDGVAAQVYVDFNGSGVNYYEGINVFNSAAGSEQIRIDGNGNMQMGIGAVVKYTPSPAVISAAATLTNGNIDSQIINTTGTSYTVTVPAGGTLDFLLQPWQTTSLGYDFIVINTASGTITMAVNTGVTSLGSLTVATGTSAQFRIRRTAASTYVLLRIA